MKILAISGSLRADSLNTRLLHAAAELAHDEVEFEVWDGLKAVPPYDQDDEDGTPPFAVARLRSAIAEADAVLFATPEYNASIPGQLKNALDWVSRPVATNPLRNIPVAVIGASPGAFGAVWAQAELKKVVALLGARVIGAELPVAQAATRFDPDGRLIDDQTRDSLRDVVNELVSAVQEREAVQATG
jgi:chromate reductase